MPSTETYSFGEWLKQRRERLRLTQREVAAAAHCSVATVKKIEADGRRPSPELAGLLAAALKIPEPERELFVAVARGDHAVDRLWHLQGEPAAPSFPAHPSTPLPKPATPFVGRASELKTIAGRLAHPDCRLLTLVGPGGAGKTRLALAAAQAQVEDAFPVEASALSVDEADASMGKALASRAASTGDASATLPAFADGAAFVPLAAVTSAQALPEAVARSLRLTLSGSPDEQVIAYLRRRRLLLVLDNCEQLEGGLAWLAELLENAPGVKVLATSRERLHLAEEWVYLVPELAESAALFVQTARRVKQDFQAEAEQADVLRICELVGNLPLAVELAASWTPLMPCAQIAGHIQRDITILAADVRNIPERHRSIQAVFDHSWNLLAGPEQAALMRLAVFRGGWHADEAQPVAGADLLLLRRLVDKSMVRVAENGRYDLHELVRHYAAQKLRLSGEEGEARRRHFDAYLALAARLDAQQYDSAAALATVLRFDQERDNLRAALAWGLEAAQTEALLKLLNHLWFYWSRRGYSFDEADWVIRVLEQAGELESMDLCTALSSAGIMFMIQGRFAEGEALAHRAIAMAQRLDDPEAIIVAAGTRTFTSTTAEEALAGLRVGIDLIKATGKLQTMLPLMYLGSATWLHSSGRYAEAEQYYRECIELFRGLGIVDFLADPLGRLGQLMLQEGRLQEAHDLTVEAIAAARVGGFAIVFSAWGTARLGLIQLYLGEVEAARRSLEEALLFFEDSPSYLRPKQEALAYLSEVALARGDVQAAAGHMQTSLEICARFYRQLQATQKLSGTPDALPLDLIGLCARAALAAEAQADDERAVTLCSVATALRSQTGQRMVPALQAKLDAAMARAQSRLPAARFRSAWEAGRAMSISETFEFLL